MAKLTGVKTIDMVGGEITKVEYNGELYAKVDGHAEVGDIVTVIRPWATVEKDANYFVLKTSESDINDYVHVDDGIVGYQEDFAAYRKVTTQPTSLESRVETLETKVAALEGNEVGESTALSVGDYAKVVGDYGDGSHDIELGTIVKITETNSDYSDRYPIEAEYISGEETDGLFHESDLVKATDEEVANAKKENAEAQAKARWAAIGRKPNEYKKGDIVHADRDDAEFTVLSVYEILSGVVSFESRKVRLEDVGLVVPVESRFDR